MNIKLTWCLLALTAMQWQARAQEIKIESLSQNGLLTWTNSNLYATCRVEWASSVNGPWHGSWDALTNIVVTNQTVSVSVPMFYRVVAVIPTVQIITNITPQTALEMITERFGSADFVVLDVRTSGEYVSGHIKQAVNMDYYSTSFQTSLDALDKKKTYLVYCGSGTRSGKAVDIMKTQGFMKVYNLLYGFSTFAAQSGARAYVEP